MIIGNFDEADGLGYKNAGFYINVYDSDMFISTALGSSLAQSRISGAGNNILDNHVLLRYKKGSGQVAQAMGVNGVQQTSYITNSAFTSFTDNANVDLLIGGSLGDGQPVNGTIAEIIVFNQALTDDQSARIESYLSTKWGLTAIVDTDEDGFTDAVEIAAGSSAVDSSSLPDNIPAVIADASVWLDATNVDGAGNATLSDGGAVDVWSDLSGNNINAAKVGAISSPIYKEAATNINQPSISFRGTDVLSFTKQTADIGMQNSDYEVFFVFQNEDTQPGFIMAGTAIEQHEVHAYNTSADDVRFIPDNSTSDASDWVDVSRPGQVNQKVAVLNVRVNDDHGLIQINGVDSPDSTNSARAATNYSIYLGQRYDGTYRFNGHISEMIIMDRMLTQLERSQINHYLATKWGLTNVVDSDADGFTDAVEITAQTDPTDRTSYAFTADFATALSDETGASTGLAAIKDSLKIWLDASNSNSIVINQSRKIDRWIDLSGHGNSVAQTDPRFQPQLKQNSAFFNTNVIDFGFDVNSKFGRSLSLTNTNIDVSDQFTVYVSWQ